jgi:hypothetical protein
MSFEGYVKRRSAVVQELLRILRSLDTQRYTVVRGAIDWARWDWPTECAIALRVPESFPADRNTGIRQSTFQCLVACKVPSGPERINDEAMDVMESDVETAFAALSRAKREGQPSDNLCFDVEPEGSVEFYDLDLLVQGHSVNFTVAY